jgi:prevent-host-death family protein
MARKPSQSLPLTTAQRLGSLVKSAYDIMLPRREQAMTTVSIQEAQAKLSELIHALTAGEEVIITEHNQPVARLVPPVSPSPRPPRRLGTLRGTVLHMAPDFDAPLEDFKEYME